jgi:ATP-dependent DNA helicase DinG
MISGELMSETYATVFVSATLSENNNFEFSKREIGLHLHKPIEIIASTSFDFHNQALLVVPAGPNPNESEAFATHCADAFEYIVGYFEGRTLGLFTSYKNMNAVAERLRGIVPDLLVQGELPRTELRNQFKERPGAVLLGTSSFWTGIDVPGQSLSAVVIDKLPFPNPSDPIVAAINELDPRSFQNFLIPRAAIQLRQGAGRLIRSKSDMGVIVVLDQRLTTARYGKRFLRSLPPMRITSELEHIPLFMAEARQWRQREAV